MAVGRYVGSLKKDYCAARLVSYSHSRPIIGQMVGQQFCRFYACTTSSMLMPFETLGRFF